MKLAIMQPYFFPYIGYFQLMNASDEFVVYDNIQFSKAGWINRNRVLVDGKASYVTLPLKKASDYADIVDRHLADSWDVERKKILNRINESYRKAPYYNSFYPVIEECLFFEENNLFRFLVNSLEKTKTYLDIKTPFVVSSTVSTPEGLKSEKRVIEICKARKADTYINPIGGTGLYQKAEFKAVGIDLCFIKTRDFVYPQFGKDFVPLLSIIDVIMFNPVEKIKEYLDSFYSLV